MLATEKPGDPVRSDPGLLAEIRRYGPFDANGCFQCGTCSAACTLSAGLAPFPRQTLRQALLGLRSRLVANPAPWICEDCGECARACPREADPKTALETLRRFLVAQYDWTGIAARVQRSRAWHLGALVAVGLLVLALVLLYHLWYAGVDAAYFVETSLGLEHMFGFITWFTVVVTLLPFLLLVSFAARMWRFLMADAPPIPARHYLAELPTYVLETVAQRKLRACERPQRWSKHWMVAVGTVVMLVVTVFFLRWFQTDAILPVYHPQRWIGYAATVLLVWGPLDLLVGRARGREGPEYSTLRDATFPFLLLGTAVSGILVHVLRYAGSELGTHYMYALHLMIVVPMLLVELPFGKWSHAVYRPLALYLEAVRARAAAAEAIGEGVAQHAP